MPDNLSIVISADTSSLQAQLAIAKAEVAAYAAEVRKAAGAVVGGDSTQLGGLEQLAGKLAGARAEVASLTSEIKTHTHTVEEHATVLGRLKEAGSAAAGGIKEAGSSLLALSGLSGGVGAIAGFFAVEGIIEFIKSTAEAAEKTENMSAALGIAPSKLALLGAEFKLVGGDIETAFRALAALETKLVEAVANPASNAREDLLKLGLSVQQMRNGTSDLPGTLALIGEGFRSMADGAERTTILSDLFTRKGFAAVVPLLRKPAEELKAEVQEALGGNLPTDAGIHKLAEYEEKLNTLGLAFGGLKKAIMSAFVEPLTEATTATTNWLKDTHKAFDDIKGLLGTASTVGGGGVGAIIGGTFLGPIGALAGAAIGATAGLDGLTTAAKTVASQLGQIGGGWEWFSQKWDDLQESLGHGRPSGTTGTGAAGGGLIGGTTEDILRDHAAEGRGTFAGAGTSPTGTAGIRGISGSPSGSGDSKQRMADWLAAHGYTADATAAIMGNASIESSFRTDAIGPGDHRGLFQESAERRKAGGIGISTDFVDQMELMDRELQKLDPAFKTATGDVAGLTKRFEQKFERSGGQLEGQREKAAGEVAASGVIKPAEEQKEMDRQIKQLEEWAKVEAKGYEVGIQGAKQDSATAIELEKQKQQMLLRTAEEEQAIRNRFAAAARDRGNAELADKYATGGTSLQEKELDTQKQLIALKQRGDEQDAQSALKSLESDRRIADQKMQTALQGVEKLREAGDITVADAEAREIRIVQDNLAANEKLFAQEAAASEKVINLHNDVANHRKEAEAKAQEDIQRIKDKAQKEEEARAHATDKQIASEFASSAVALAWGKQTPQQALAGFEQKIETKTLEFVGTKLLDSLGVGKILDKLGDQITKFFGGTVESTAASAAANAPVVAAITGAGPIANATAMTPVLETQTAQIVAAIAGGASSGAGGSIIGGAVSGGLGLAAKAGFAGGPAVAATLSSGTSVFDALIPDLLAIPFLDRGGIIPSAADGMIADGKGGRLSILHPQEMVLPRDLSLGLQSMIRRPSGWTIPAAPASFSLSPSFGAGAGASAAGGSTPVQINISAIDGRSVERFFKDNSALVAKSVAGAKRNFVGAAQ